MSLGGAFACLPAGRPTGQGEGSRRGTSAGIASENGDAPRVRGGIVPRKRYASMPASLESQVLSAIALMLRERFGVDYFTAVLGRQII